MRRSLALLLLLAACDPGGLYAELYLPIYVAEGVDDPRVHIDSIEGVFGVEVRQVPPDVCALTLHPRNGYEIEECMQEPTDPTLAGCRRGAEIFCIQSYDTCAHELGHAAGLGHRSDPRNVMATGSAYTKVADDDQIAAVEALGLAFAVCRKVRYRSEEG